MSTSLTINGKKYTISLIDNIDSIKRMIALKEKSLPEYIIFKEFNDKNIVPEFLQDSVKTITEKMLKKEIPELQNKWNLSRSELLMYWLNITGRKELHDYDIALQEFFKELVPEFSNISTINNRYKEYTRNIKNREKELTELVKKENEFKNQYSDYESVKTTKFIQDSVITEWKLSTNYDPPEFFDKLILTNDISFASLNFGELQAYKIFQGIVPDKTWADFINNDKLNTIIIKYNNGKYTITLNFTSPENIRAIVETETSNQNLEEILTIILNNVSGLEYKIISKQEQGIKGVFAIPEFNMNRYVMLDLLSNDPMIENYFYIDETRDLSSGKSVLYLYFSPLSGTSITEIPVTVYLSQKVANRSDIFFINKEMPIFTEYLNVRISRAKNLDQINRFIKTFSLLIDIYNKKFNDIVKKYSGILPEFEGLSKIVKSKKITSTARVKELQSANPDLFVTGYPTKCESKKQPIPVTKKEAKKNSYPINYPLDSDDWYICPDSNFKYPGFQKNKLDNAEEYPYLPCCYPKQGRPFRLYDSYSKGELETEKKETKKIITSNLVKTKAITFGKIGLLPKNIWYILKDFGNFYRYGINISESSFITAIATAIDPNYKKITDTKKQNKYINDLRNNLASLPFGLISQQFWDKSSEFAINQILDKTIPFDSKFYTPLLEKYYNIQIIVFERTENNPNGSIEIPNYSIGYFTDSFDSTKQTVLIYKHNGIRSDHLVFPHYEIIIQDIVNSKFYFQGKLVTHLNDIYQNIYKLYNLNDKNKLEILNTSNYFSNQQIIDNFGKATGYIKNNIYIATNPTKPFGDIVEMPKTQPDVISKNYKIISQEPYPDSNKLIGFVPDISGFNYSFIPVTNKNKLINTPIDYNIGAPLLPVNGLIEQTLTNKKIANFMLQLASWSYCNFVKSKWNSIQKTITEKNLAIAQVIIAEKLALTELVDSFIRNNTVIIPNHDYKIKTLGRKLTTNNNFFNKDNQLIVDSETTLNKLIFYLKHNFKSIRIIELISSQEYLIGFYTNIQDFIQQPNVNLLLGTISFENWLISLNNNYVTFINNKLNLSSKEPIFFKNPNINSGKLVIIQNVINGDKSRAISVSINYSKLLVNTGYYTLSQTDTNESLDGNIMIFKYKENKFYSESKKSKIMILQYFDNYYASILPLE